MISASQSSPLKCTPPIPSEWENQDRTPQVILHVAAHDPGKAVPLPIEIERAAPGPELRRKFTYSPFSEPPSPITRSGEHGSPLSAATMGATQKGPPMTDDATPSKCKD